MRRYLWPMRPVQGKQVIWKKNLRDGTRYTRERHYCQGGCVPMVGSPSKGIKLRRKLNHNLFLILSMLHPDGLIYPHPRHRIHVFQVPSSIRWQSWLASSAYLPNNWRTPTMIAYDVQAHPFNRAPSAAPQMTINRAGSSVYTDTDMTGGSSRSSVWSVDIEQGGCQCLAGYFSKC